MNLFSLFKTTPAIEPEERCSQCRKAVGAKTSIRETLLSQYGQNPAAIALIEMGQMDGPHGTTTAEAILAGGFVCQKCQAKYCMNCGKKKNLRCCGVQLLIGTHYFHQAAGSTKKPADSSSETQKLAFKITSADTAPPPEFQSWVSMLGRNDLLGPDTHRQNLLRLGDRAIPYLLPLLDLPLRDDRNDLTREPPEFQNNVTIVAAVINVLRELYAKQAISKLEALAETNWVEVQRNARISLLALKASSTVTGPKLDRNAPYQEIANYWTTIFQGKQMPLPPDALRAWATDAIASIADLSVPEGKTGNAWAMLGAIYYKSFNPDWDGNYLTIQGRCPEAKRCYEEALKIELQPMWRSCMERL
jgi:hypothetical protein